MSLVELVLKSPTDRIAPFTVQCDHQWTIKQLKIHIKDAYPCKPSVESQKFIYVGKLLKDDQIIKDIFEPNSSTIVHFICQSSINEDEKDTEKAKEKKEIAPEMYSELYGEYQTYLNNFYSSQTQALGNMNHQQQMMWINQVYMQTYANYCAQFNKPDNGSQGAPNKEPVVQPAAEVSVHNQQDNAQNNDRRPDGAGENGMQNMMAAAFGGLMGDGGEDENDGEIEPRDILHYFYMLVRFGLLLLICYYYSSLVSVVTTMMLFFLFFGVNILRRNNNANQPPVVVPPPVANNETPSAPMQPTDEQIEQPVESVPEQVTNSAQINFVTAIDRGSPTFGERLKQVATTSLQFVLTFFVTLFPEPIAHVDIN